MRRSKFAAAWWSFTILCQCRPFTGLPELAVLALAVALENGGSWILRSAVSAEPLASTRIHFVELPHDIDRRESEFSTYRIRWYRESCTVHLACRSARTILPFSHRAPWTAGK